MNASRVVGWTAAFLGLILIGNLYLHNKKKEERAVLSLVEIEEIWLKTSPEFRGAVFNNSLATAGIMVSSTGEFLAREPLLDSDCRGEVMAARAIEARGNIPEPTVRAIVHASACYTLTGRRG